MVIGGIHFLIALLFLAIFHFTPNDANSDYYCGFPLNYLTNRIVGGMEAEMHEYPWLTKLLKNGHYFCGSVLIADRYVLTAGHCVVTQIDGASLLPRHQRRPDEVINYRVQSPLQFSVELGSHYTNEPYTNVVVKQVLDIFVYPGYDNFVSHGILLQTNDIALLKTELIQFNPNIIPICLPQQDEKVPDKSSLIVAGWGSVNFETVDVSNIQLATALKKTLVTKIPWYECRHNPYMGMHLASVNQLTDREIMCLIGNDTDACRGDSGGPAFIMTNHGYTLAGLVSWGIGCNQKDYAAAYTQVSSYMNFIYENSADGMFPPSAAYGL